MNPDPNDLRDDPFSSWLADCDEALAAGLAPPSLEEGEAPAELQARLEHGLEVLQRLEQVWPRQRSTVRPAAGAPATPLPPQTAAAGRELLFGMLALQAGLLEQAEFVEACALWLP